MLLYILTILSEVHSSPKHFDRAEEYINGDLKINKQLAHHQWLISNTKKSEVMLIGTNHAVKIARELQVRLDR